MTDKEKVRKLYELIVNDLSRQVDGVDFLGSALAVGGEELLAFDDGRGLWIALMNSTDEMNKIIKEVKDLASPVVFEKAEGK